MRTPRFAMLGLALLGLLAASEANAVIITVDTANSADFTMVDRNGTPTAIVDTGGGISAAALSYYDVSFAFNLPVGFVNPSLTWTSFVADDRAIVVLNDSILG